MYTFSSPNLAGVHTALVTPFTASGRYVDYSVLRELTEIQVQAGIQGVVPVGTTGESPTLSPHEHLRVIQEVIHQVRGRVFVTAGVGSNSTNEALLYAREATSMGAQGGLSVVPYYNKPNQEGIYQHFRVQAEAAPELSIILYSIPSRCGTGVQLEIPTIIRLVRDCPNIVGIKEAGGDIDRFATIRRALDDAGFPGFQILSGDDALTLPAIERRSASGVISVASNVIPAEMSQLVQYANSGEIDLARQLVSKHQELFRVLFLKGEPNPQGVKYVLSRIHAGFQNVLRLPLVPVSAANQPEILRVIHCCGIQID